MNPKFSTTLFARRAKAVVATVAAFGLLIIGNVGVANADVNPAPAVRCIFKSSARRWLRLSRKFASASLVAALVAFGVLTGTTAANAGPGDPALAVRVTTPPLRCWRVRTPCGR